MHARHTSYMSCNQFLTLLLLHGRTEMSAPLESEEKLQETEKPTASQTGLITTILWGFYGPDSEAHPRLLDELESLV
jgi:hypothetical protein